MVNKIISFSLWGDNPKYCVGAVKNIQLASLYYPGWNIHVYYNNTVPEIYLDQIEFYNNTILYEMDNGFGAFWRFYSMKPGTIVISRDTDSRLSEREAKIVNDWLETDKKLCCIRDHANHYEFPIMAGMFGIRDGLTEDMFRKMIAYTRNHNYLVDQIFLKDVVWPQLINDSVVYGIKETDWMNKSYLQIDKDFIGQTYDENDKPVYNAIKLKETYV